MKAPRSRRTSGTGNRPMGFQDWGLIIILSVLWGGSFFFVGVAVKVMPSLTIVLCRVALAAVILLAVVYLKGDKMPASQALWGRFIVMGALNNLIPFSAVLLGVLFLGERPGWNALAGMGLIFTGLVVIDGRLLNRFKRQAEVWFADS